MWPELGSGCFLTDQWFSLGVGSTDDAAAPPTVPASHHPGVLDLVQHLLSSGFATFGLRCKCLGTAAQGTADVVQPPSQRVRLEVGSY